VCSCTYSTFFPPVFVVANKVTSFLGLTSLCSIVYFQQNSRIKYSVQLSTCFPAKLTILLSAQITHLWPVPTKTNVSQIISFPFKLNCISAVRFCLFFTLLLSFATGHRRSYTLHVYIKVADLNGISFHFLDEQGHLASPWNLSYFPTALWSLPVPQRSNFTICFTQPRAPLDPATSTSCSDKGSFPHLLKAYFLHDISRSKVFLWTGDIQNRSASVLLSHSVHSITDPQLWKP